MFNEKSSKKTCSSDTRVNYAGFHTNSNRLFLFSKAYRYTYNSTFDSLLTARNGFLSYVRVSETVFVDRFPPPPVKIPKINSVKNK